MLKSIGRILLILVGVPLVLLPGCYTALRLVQWPAHQRHAARGHRA